VGADWGQEAAKRVLEAILAGEAPDRADMVALADEVLQQPLVRAALEVKGGGPHQLQRAGELAVAALSSSGVVAEGEEAG
jgi:hypothetical protein